MPSWDWKASLIGLLLALAMTKIVGQQGTKSAWVLRATLHLSVPIGHWAHATRRLENLQGRSSAPRPAPSPLSKGRWTWGLLVAFGLPSQGLPSGGKVPVSLRFPGSLEGRPSFPGPLWPLLPPCGLPGQEASVHQGPALLSLAPLRPVSAAPLLGSWAPAVPAAPAAKARSRRRKQIASLALSPFKSSPLSPLAESNQTTASVHGK